MPSSSFIFLTLFLQQLCSYFWSIECANMEAFSIRRFGGNFESKAHRVLKITNTVNS